MVSLKHSILMISEMIAGCPLSWRRSQGRQSSREDWQDGFQGAVFCPNVKVLETEVRGAVLEM